jgi:hypothetical protein
MHAIRYPTGPLLGFTGSLVFAAAIAGCDPGEQGDTADEGDSTAATERVCELEDRTDAFAVGLEKQGEYAVMRLADAMPARPYRGDNVWLFDVTDLDGNPMEDMQLRVTTWMPDHGHGSNVDPVVSFAEDGQLRIDGLNLHMAGYWEITVGITMAEEQADEIVFAVCVE